MVQKFPGIPVKARKRNTSDRPRKVLPFFRKHSTGRNRAIWILPGIYRVFRTNGKRSWCGHWERERRCVTVRLHEAEGKETKMAARCLSVPSFEFSRILRISWIVGILVHTTYVFIKSVKESVKRAPQKEQNEQTAPQVLFFPDKLLACRQFLFEGGCSRRHCQFAHEKTSLSKLVRVLLEAKQSLDVCVFTINCRELADAVVQLHNDGVVVRVLTDDEQMGSTGSQIEKFRREGIQVRHDLSSFFMHHKFAIIDRKQLVNGSFNWTRQAVTGNRENVVITSDEGLVKAFSDEFQKLWEKYDPCRRTQSGVLW